MSVVWEKELKNKKIVFHWDNMVVVYSWNNHRSTDSKVLTLIRRIAMLAALNNFNLTLRHVPCVENRMADSLSRLQISAFRELNPEADELPAVIPEFLSAIFRQDW